MWYASTGPVDCPTAGYEEQARCSDRSAFRSYIYRPFIWVRRDSFNTLKKHSKLKGLDSALQLKFLDRHFLKETLFLKRKLLPWSESIMHLCSHWGTTRNWNNILVITNWFLPVTTVLIICCNCQKAVGDSCNCRELFLC